MSSRRFHTLPRLATFALAFSFAATAQTPAADPHHHHDKAPAEKPVLKKGARWQTDAPLREGMEEIKQLISEALPRAHVGKFSPADYEKLGKSVDAEIQTIFSKCKLPPDADAALHAILVKIIEGSTTVKSAEAKRVNGLLQMMKATNEYGETFDHPGWEPIRH